MTVTQDLFNASTYFTCLSFAHLSLKEYAVKNFIAENFSHGNLYLSDSCL
nr:MAG TPA: hypothetical protein [Caudoviricetes sp.]